MNNVASITLRSLGLCSRTASCSQPGQLFRRALHTADKISLGTPALVPWKSTCVASLRGIRPATLTSRCLITTTQKRAFRISYKLERLKPYDEEREDGLTFRKKDLSNKQLSAVYGDLKLDPILANRLLKVLQARRVDGTLDVPLDEDLTWLQEQFPQAQDLALMWLRNNYPVDEDAAILARLQREDAPREQEHPSALMERAQKLGLVKTQDESQKSDPEYYGPQSGRFYARLSEKQDDVFGRSQLERIRAENEAKAEEEDKQMQERIDKSMEDAQAKAIERSQALAERPEQSIEVSDGKQVRPPNEFEKWVIRLQEKASSGLSLESPEITNMTSAQRILPSFLFVLVACGGLYLFAQYWEPPRRSERIFPDVSLSFATCGGILAANVFVYMLWRFPPARTVLNKYFLVAPAYPHVLSIFGNLFSHYSTRHLLVNMISLFIFGPSLHEDIGRGSFIAIYLASGLVGSLVSLSSFVFRGVLFTTSMGASGCIWGITTAYLWIHKDNSFSFIFIPREYQDQALAKGWMLLAALVMFDVVASIRKAGIDIAAHVTGMVVGLVTSSIWKAEHGEVKRSARQSFFAGLLDEVSRRVQK